MRGDERQTDNLAAGLTFLCRTFIGFTEFPIGEKKKTKTKTTERVVYVLSLSAALVRILFVRAHVCMCVGMSSRSCMRKRGSKEG